MTIRFNNTYSVEYVFEPMTSSRSDGEAQLENILVSKGQTVKQGQMIGRLYAASEGAHVHFGLYKHATANGNPAICPGPYFTPTARSSILNLIHHKYPNSNICN